MSRKCGNYRPTLEGLEERIVPYALAGSKWSNLTVSASFLPDGTLTDSGKPSDLFARLNTVAPTAAWQREFARALQTWASVSNLNFVFVPDNGLPVGTSGQSQGDSRFGDIRLGGYARSDSYIAYAYYPGGGTRSGDIFLATNYTFYINAYPDLYSVLLHEAGHALGLGHSTSGTVMYPTITGIYTGLSADDIAGIQALYGVRQHDLYDAAAPNDTFATATALALDSTGAVTIQADLTSLADVDFYRVVTPASFDGTLQVALDARDRSLLGGKISVYDAAHNLIGTASAGSAYGTLVTLNLAGLAPGQTYYLVADGAANDVFGTGAYQLRVQFGGAVPQPPPLPSLSISNVALTEGDSGSKLFNFTVTLSAPSTSTVTVQYATANGTATAGSDYLAASGTLTFALGETQKTIAITVLGDTVAEPDETFYVHLSSPTNAVLAVSEGQGTIRNDDLGPDRFEINDTLTAATNLGKSNSISQAALTLHTATDVDHYSFVPPKSGTFRISITPAQAGGTIVVTVLNTQQTVVVSGQWQTGGLTLTASLTGNQRYYVKVSSPTGTLFTYDLAIARSGGNGRGGGGRLPDDDALGHGMTLEGIAPPDDHDHDDDHADHPGSRQPAVNPVPAPPRGPFTIQLSTNVLATGSGNENRFSGKSSRPATTDDPAWAEILTLPDLIDRSALAG